MCGEKRRRASLPRAVQGSPPRVRGEVLQATAGSPCKRITPACAGRRNHADWLRRTGWDHPRVCGEKAADTYALAGATGSPPRVRGEASFNARSATAVGITPACAGRSARCTGFSPPSEDHPRVCGEKLVVVLPVKRPLGSPPRVRGEVQDSEKEVLDERITPACAGRRAEPIKRAGRR